MRWAQLDVHWPTASRPRNIFSSSSGVRMPAAAMVCACAWLAATSWGSRRQSKGKLRCHCSKVRSSGSRKRPDHILVAFCCCSDIVCCGLNGCCAFEYFFSFVFLVVIPAGNLLLVCPATKCYARLDKK